MNRKKTVETVEVCFLLVFLYVASYLAFVPTRPLSSTWYPKGFASTGHRYVHPSAPKISKSLSYWQFYFWYPLIHAEGFLRSDPILFQYIGDHTIIDGRKVPTLKELVL